MVSPDAESEEDAGLDPEVQAALAEMNLAVDREAENPAYSPDGSPHLFEWQLAGCEPAYSYFEWWYPRPQHSPVSDDDDDWAVRLIPQQQPSPSPMTDVHNCNSSDCNYSPCSSDDDAMHVCSGGTH